jgi:hypothetical protein
MKNKFLSFKNKQLFVQYQCVDSDILSKMNNCIPNTAVDSICPTLSLPSFQENRDWCSLSDLDIQCSGGKKINVII